MVKVDRKEWKVENKTAKLNIKHEKLKINRFSASQI
jgi:hypothetical protein